MLLSSLARLLLGTFTTLTVADLVASQGTCTVTSRGGDDAPQLLRAVKSCGVTRIPKGTVLNIATRLDMTGLSNKTIVRQLLVYLFAL